MKTNFISEHLENKSILDLLLSAKDNDRLTGLLIIKYQKSIINIDILSAFIPIYLFDFYLSEISKEIWEFDDIPSNLKNYYKEPIFKDRNFEIDTNSILEGYFLITEINKNIIVCSTLNIFNSLYYHENFNVDNAGMFYKVLILNYANIEYDERLIIKIATSDLYYITDYERNEGEYIISIIKDKIRWNEKVIYEISANGSRFFKFIPKNLLTKEICEIALKNNPYNLNNIPESLLDYKMVENALKIEPQALLTMPKMFGNKEIYTYCVSKYGCNIKYVPHKFVDKELLKLALKQDIQAIKYIPNFTDDIDIYKFAIDECECGLMYFPKQFQTKEFVNTAIKRDVFDIRYASSEFLNDELLFWAIKTNNKIVKYIPKDVFSISIYKYLIENKIIIPDNISKLFIDNE